jgi:NADPH:quinone reductase-like Zn-dependent oxidoreductase
VHAIIQERYCQPEQLVLQEVARPTPGDEELLVRVHATSVNPLDWHQITGKPYIMRMQGGLRRPKQRTPGTDIAGVVEAVGAAVTQFRVGDEVFGATSSGFAEYASIAEKAAVLKPATVTFEQAAAVPVAAITALQALRGKANVRSGQQVLINGASGGVGIFAVQIARSMGAVVTAVCSTRNVEMIRDLGAVRVLDYTRDDFTTDEAQYDVMIDMIGNRPLRACRRTLRPGGSFVLVGGPDRGRLLGPVTHMIKAVITFRFGGRKAVPFMARLGKEDLLTLSGMLADGSLTAVIERAYPLAESGAAVRHVMDGHTRGKVVITT